MAGKLLKNGSKGTDVKNLQKALQQQLYALGYQATQQPPAQVDISAEMTELTCFGTTPPKLLLLIHNFRIFVKRFIATVVRSIWMVQILMPWWVFVDPR